MLSSGSSLVSKLLTKYIFQYLTYPKNSQPRTHPSEMSIFVFPIMQSDKCVAFWFVDWMSTMTFGDSVTILPPFLISCAAWPGVWSTMKELSH